MKLSCIVYFKHKYFYFISKNSKLTLRVILIKVKIVFFNSSVNKDILEKTVTNYIFIMSQKITLKMAKNENGSYFIASSSGIKFSTINFYNKT